jgi:tripartite motif-containing protein 71
VENDHKIYKYNVRPSGTLQIGGKFGSFGTGNGRFNVPLALALSPTNHRLYVVDSGNCRIQSLNSNTGAFVRAFGSCGSGNGQFRAPKGIAVAANGDIFVSDAALNRIQRFTNTGVFIEAWGTPGSGIGQLDAPSGLAFLADGTLAVCDTRNHRIVLYHKLNNKAVLRTFGQNGIQPQEFKLPTSITQNPVDGTLYVAEFGNNRIQVVNPDGSFVKMIGSADQLAGPTNVFIRGQTLHVASTVSNRVVFFLA